MRWGNLGRWTMNLTWKFLSACFKIWEIAHSDPRWRRWRIAQRALGPLHIHWQVRNKHYEIPMYLIPLILIFFHSFQAGPGIRPYGGHRSRCDECVLKVPTKGNGWNTKCEIYNNVTIFGCVRKLSQWLKVARNLSARHFRHLRP